MPQHDDEATSPNRASRRSSRTFAIVRREYGDLFDTPTADLADQAMADWTAMTPAERSYHQARLQFATIRALDELLGVVRSTGNVMVEGFEMLGGLVGGLLDDLRGAPEEEGEQEEEQEEDEEPEPEPEPVGDPLSNTEEEAPEEGADEPLEGKGVIDGQFVEIPADEQDVDQDQPPRRPARRFPRLEASDEE